ncbi:MAG TPA: FAD-dependent monooxygenase [Polyangiales bacterium]|nr:FAD-dependent monooxygenase [Polyangiales bacterium]
MTSPDRSRALVVGAGIGGLAAAIALSRAGFSVIVLERASELRELGFALLLAPNAMRALRVLGVADQVTTRAEVAREGQLRTTTGRVLKQVSLAGLRRATGEDSVCALRQVVYGSLLDAAQSCGVEVRTGAQALGFEETPSGVELVVLGSERVAGALLVGADGIHSTLRAALHGDSLRPSGLCAYRGVSRGVSFPVTGAQYFGRGTECGVGRAGGDAVYWYVCEKQNAAHAELAPKQAALEIVRGFDPALVELVQHTEPDDVRRDEMFDRKPLANWGRGRVTLLGDAAHPMLPHAGQGAAQALEDAVVLGRCLAKDGNIETALRRYERLRAPRANHVVVLSRRNAKVGSLEARWSCALRDWFLQHGPSALMEKQMSQLANASLEV